MFKYTWWIGKKGKNFNKNESFPLKEDSPKLTRLNPLPFPWNYSMIFQIIIFFFFACKVFVVVLFSIDRFFSLHPFPMLTIEMTCVTCHFHVFVVIVIYFFICLKNHMVAFAVQMCWAFAFCLTSYWKCCQLFC